MRTYNPDLWSLIEIAQDDGEKLVKVLASWYGGYAGSNSWKLSSGVTDVKMGESWAEITNHSGSVYTCHESNYGMSGYTASVYQTFVDQAGDRIRLLTEAEAGEYLNACAQQA